MIGRITASAGSSWFSWGENITIVVERIDAATTRIAIDSSLKVGINLAGAHRHIKNFEKIIAALSSHLQSVLEPVVKDGVKANQRGGVGVDQYPIVGGFDPGIPWEGLKLSPYHTFLASILIIVATFVVLRYVLGFL